jgi:hypothetical protein
MEQQNSIDHEWASFVNQLQESDNFGRASFTASFRTPTITNKTQQSNQKKSEPLRPINTTIPECPEIQETDLHFSTRTQSIRINRMLNIDHLFWNLPMIEYWQPQSGIVKKEMKRTIETLEAFSDYEKHRDQLIETYQNTPLMFREKVSKHIDNPNARKKKFKDVRKVSIGITKRDILNSKKKDKNAFSNCFVLYLRFKYGNQYCENHVKIFNTGKMEAPGVHDYTVLENIQNLLYQLLYPFLVLPNKIPSYPPDNEEPLAFYIHNSLESKNVLINSDFNCRFYLDRKKVCQIIKGEKYGLDAFIVGDYPGVKCKFYFNNNLEFDYGTQSGRIDSEDRTMNMKALSQYSKYTIVTFTLFRTGSCLISGCCSEKMIRFVFHFVRNLLKEEYLEIRSCYEDPVIKNKKHKPRKRIIYITRDYLESLKLSSAPTTQIQTLLTISSANDLTTIIPISTLSL